MLARVEKYTQVEEAYGTHVAPATSPLPALEPIIASLPASPLPALEPKERPPTLGFPPRKEDQGKG